MKFIYWSNAIYLLPTLALVSVGKYYVALFFLLTIFISLGYHFQRHAHLMVYSWWDWVRPKNKYQRIFLYLDYSAALILAYINLTYIYTSQNIFSYIAIILFFIGFFFMVYRWKTQYNMHHSLWHIFSGLASFFSVLSIIFIS